MISNSSRHAIWASIELAALPAGEFAGAADLAERTGAPANYLGKLLQALAIAGVLESRKGPRGGFRLARPAASISLFTIVDALSDLGPWSGCILGLPTCSTGTACPLHDGWAALREAYLKLLSETSLSDLAPAGNGRGATRSSPGMLRAIQTSRGKKP
jgi:Rrf2 family protein